MKFCEDCTEPHRDEFTSCQKCGGNLLLIPKKEKQTKPINMKRIAVGGGILALFAMIGGGFLLTTMENPPVTNPNTQVEYAPEIDSQLDPPPLENQEVPKVEVELLDPSTIEMENRIFTTHDFSFVGSDTAFLNKIQMCSPNPEEEKPDYSLLPVELLTMFESDMLADSGNSMADPTENFLHSNYECYSVIANYYYMSALLAQAIEDQSKAELWAENMIDITEEELLINGYTVGRTVAKVEFDYSYLLPDVESDDSQSSKVEFLEVFRLPYPDDDGKYFDLLLNGETPLAEEEYMPALSTILDTFVSNKRLMEYNSDGMAKFSSTSFSAYYNPDTFTQERTPYRVNDFTSHYTLDKIFLTLEDSEETGYLDITTIEGVSIADDEGYSTEQSGEHRFQVKREMVPVIDVTGSVSEKEMITSLVHDSNLYPELYTFIDFRSMEEDGYRLTQSDYQKITEAFELIISTYEVNLSLELEAEYNT